MPIVTVIPVKSLADGKQRLGEKIAPEIRRQLVEAMASHVAAASESAGALPVVVTADTETAGWAAAHALPVVEDPAQGLDAAVRAGVDWAVASGCQWLVLHGDLPLLTVGDMASLVHLLGEGAQPIAPSADGGTSAIGGREPMAFSYGPASFRRHLAMLASPQVVNSLGLAHEIDSVQDLASARRHPRGAWLDEVLAGTPQ